VIFRDGTETTVTNPEDFPPDSSAYKECLEPVVRANIIAPSQYYGSLIALCSKAGGEQESVEHIDEHRIRFTYIIPLSEVVIDFYDNLKQTTAGLASFDYEEHGYREADHVKMDIKVNGEILPPLSVICHKDRAVAMGRQAVEKLKEKIPRQLFVVPIQAVIGSKVISRVSITAVRKDVTAKCYGGDITRKRKLLEKQKEGKKRLRSFGNIEVSQETLQSMLKR
jgi:GTP-binding protein LepA